MQLVLAYHTSVIQQRKIVWEQMVSLFQKNVWWVLQQLPFAENHEYKSSEDELTMQKDAVHYNNWEHRELHNLYGFYQVEYQEAKS